MGYSHPNHAGFIGNFISDLTLMVAAQRDERGVANDEAADEGIEALRAGGGAGAGTEEAEGLYFRLRDVDQAGLARGRELLQRWRDMSRGVGDPKDEHTKPLKPHACAMGENHSRVGLWHRMFGAVSERGAERAWRRALGGRDRP